MLWRSAFGGNKESPRPEGWWWLKSISTMLGQSNLSRTVKYLYVLCKTFGQEMNQLAEKLNFQVN
jgi:hypothetical protein